MIVRRIILQFISLLLWCTAVSQANISGIITDSIGKPIPFTQVLLKPESNNTIMAFAQSDNEGEYRLRINTHGDYLIEFRAMSYQTKIYPITILESQREQNITINPTLTHQSVAISEVIVMGERPITIKRDTVIFRASAFTHGDEQVAEDVLKRLPGIEVTEDGGISWQGKEVEKVMIEGDDLFGKGYRLISRNLNAQVIDRVEVYERYSHNPLLKNIEESNKVALNLTIREDVRLTFFGNTTLGYSTNETHMARGNLMSIGRKQKYYLFSNSNSIGINPVGDIRHFIRPQSQNVHESTPNERDQPQNVINLHGFHPNFGAQRVRDNNSHMLSLNSILSGKEGLTLKLITFGVIEHDNFFREGFQSYNIDNTSFTNNEIHELTKKNRNGLGKLEINYKPSNNSMLVLISQVLHSKGNSNSTLLFNTRPTGESLENKNLNTDHKLTYTNRISNNTAVLITGHYQYDIRPEKLSVSNVVLEDLFYVSQPTNGISQNVNSQMHLAWGQAKIITRFRESFNIDSYIGGILKSSNLVSNLKIISNEEDKIVNGNFSNNLSHNGKDIYLGSNLTRRVGSFAFNFEANGHILFLETENVGYSKNQTIPYIEPKAGLQWEINRMNTLDLLFVYNASPTTLIELTSGYIFTSYRSLRTGLGEFALSRGYTSMFRYRFGRSIDRFFFNTNIIHSSSVNYFSTDSYITPSYSFLANTLGSDRDVLSASASADLYINSLRSNIRLRGNYIIASYENRVNEKILDVETHNMNVGSEVRTSFDGLINFHFGTSWIASKAKANQFNTNLDNNQFFDLLFKFSESLNAQVNFERYEFGNIESPDNPWFFIDANATYRYKPNKLSFTFTANNLLNNNEFGNYSVTEISESGTIFRIIPRYFMIRVDYRF